MRLTAALITLLVAALPASAQSYPTRPITVVVPFPAGGPSDVVARIVAEHMGKVLGQTMVIENVGGAGGGMNQTFQNSAQVLSIGIFFTLMIVGLASTLPQTLSSGLQDHGVPAATAHQVANLPPVSILFAAFLGYNPIEHLVGPHVLGALSAHDQAALTGSAFFPNLISGPFRTGLHWAFAFAIVACLIGAAASLLRGGRAETPARKEQHEDPMARPVRVPARN